MPDTASTRPAVTVEWAKQPDVIGEGDIGDQETVDAPCAMRRCANLVGWVNFVDEDTYGREREGYRWVDHLVLTVEGDAEPTLFCEDCAGWFDDIARALDGDEERGGG